MALGEFAAAVGVSEGAGSGGRGGMDRDEVECLLANMIYKVCTSPLLSLWQVLHDQGCAWQGGAWRC